ncbi:DUF1534 domain-containing protein [Pseudomonas syringae]|nr:DUF1534 domain-containing protein [Pseudomonas syringae]MCF5313907.1 DUF1534 domain-containing protein [Pseudomonas syringae]MCF5364634.1 DUF1534 domain-containing protein [Pseudomonas syringae]MCF5394278.1 DUF1534 domain-containing protein [Pseudomonas syringae]MCF5402468.1 DUF1534 domain-containing protein [Pseudomonas syringae]
MDRAERLGSDCGNYRANAPRWHAFRDALRHPAVQHLAPRIGRGASRTAFPRGA